MEYVFLSYVILVNITAFIIIYIDKKRAINHKWRIKESTLFILSLIGGSLGTLLGMYTFRHKTKHIKFTLGIPLIMLLQILIFFFLYK